MYLWEGWSIGHSQQIKYAIAVSNDLGIFDLLFSGFGVGCDIMSSSEFMQNNKRMSKEAWTWKFIIPLVKGFWWLAVERGLYWSQAYWLKYGNMFLICKIHAFVRDLKFSLIGYVLILLLRLFRLFYSMQIMCQGIWVGLFTYITF